MKPVSVNLFFVPANQFTFTTKLGWAHRENSPESSSGQVTGDYDEYVGKVKGTSNVSSDETSATRKISSGNTRHMDTMVYVVRVRKRQRNF